MGLRLAFSTGETVGIAVLRDGKELQLEATFQDARRR